MQPEPGFIACVDDAYAHLYDLVYLRVHPLIDLLLRDSPVPRKEKAWHLHRILLDAIGHLEPEPQVPVFSRQWRRHRLMVLRYVKALEQQAVMEELAVSRRTYYREHRTAIEGLAAILWERCAAPPASSEVTAPPDDQDQSALSHVELLRIETARIAQAERYAQLAPVAQEVLSLLDKMLVECGMHVSLDLPEGLPAIAIDYSLLRQMLFGLLGYLLEHASDAALRLTAQCDSLGVRLSLEVEPPLAVDSDGLAVGRDALACSEEIAALSGAAIQVRWQGTAITGFDVSLPAVQRTVLVVDDNADVIELFRRYLTPHGYQVAAVQAPTEVLTLAQRLRPYAVTLDLMMPEQDGWDLLQLLLTQPDTRCIPVIVCSVLRQKQLALSLGATTFLEKPITEQALLSALDALAQR